ncbi:hypothetical protein L3X38_028095 [Prunus dulcis]|uniref:GDSL-like Lipase/Acylhydrolase superfamily protein n=1 Tax=Prunus dulcis TaxID=3755 RepID=A0AAD4VPA7_PRUDU|nr:hypothetical protein L3X38_028095 [Prunus dulcis]
MLLSKVCLPLDMTLAPEDDRDGIGCVKSANNQTYGHNLVLQAKLQQLRTQFPHAVITYADYWNAYFTVMKNPNHACPSPSQYINWDGVHLTEAMYKVLTDMFLNGKATHPPFSYLLDMKLRRG